MQIRDARRKEIYKKIDELEEAGEKLRQEVYSASQELKEIQKRGRVLSFTVISIFWCAPSGICVRLFETAKNVQSKITLGQTKKTQKLSKLDHSHTSC